jgi:hypothetical protein
MTRTKYKVELPEEQIDAFVAKQQTREPDPGEMRSILKVGDITHPLIMGPFYDTFREPRGDLEVTVGGLFATGDIKIRTSAIIDALASSMLKRGYTLVDSHAEPKGKGKNPNDDEWKFIFSKHRVQRR